MNKWFIFTSRGGMAVVESEDLTRAIAIFRKRKPKNSGEIVGVIKAAAAMDYQGRPMPSPVFGVICCVADASTQPSSPG